jgi:hypothetical protein
MTELSEDTNHGFCPSRGIRGTMIIILNIFCEAESIVSSGQPRMSNDS